MYPPLALSNPIHGNAQDISSQQRPAEPLPSPQSSESVRDSEGLTALWASCSHLFETGARESKRERLGFSLPHPSLKTKTLIFHNLKSCLTPRALEFLDYD